MKCLPAIARTMFFRTVGQSYHGEVVYSVMKLVHCLHPRRAINFTVDRRLGSALERIWHPDWPRDETWEPAASGRLRDKMLAEIEDDEPSDFELLVLVTAPTIGAGAGRAMARFKSFGHDARFMIVLHHPLESPGRSMLGYKSAWAAGVSPLIAAETPRYFSPIENPVPHGGAQSCDRPPTYIIVGGGTRRDTGTLAAILQSERLKDQKFEIVWLAQVKKGSLPFADPRLITFDEFVEHDEFNRRMIGAAFMLPLCKDRGA